MSTSANISYISETPLRHTYPYGRFDVELQFSPAEQLRADISAVYRTVPECRRIIVAIDQGDISAIAICEDAGLRYSLDVETRDGREISLMVHEPDWVANQSTEIEDLELS